MNIEDFKNDPTYQKLSPAGKDLFRKILERCEKTGEDPVKLLDRLREIRRQDRGERS